MASQLNEMQGQRQLMADQLEEIRREGKIQRLNKEMDFVVGPLRSKIGSYKVYEPLYLEKVMSEQSIAFWEDIKKNLYLTSDDLRLNIDRYLAVFEEQSELLRRTRYDIKYHVDSYCHEHGIAETAIPRYKVLFNPAPISEGYNSYLKNIENGNKEIGYDSAYGKIRANLLELINENHKYDIRVDDQVDIVSIHDARYHLENAVKRRYDAINNELSEVLVGSIDAGS